MLSKETGGDFISKYKILIILIIGSMLSGCIQVQPPSLESAYCSIRSVDPKCTSTYYSETDSRNYFEFHGDKTFYLAYFENNVDLSKAGTFEVRDDNITVITTRGDVGRLRIENNTLIDRNGARWTKR